MDKNISTLDSRPEDAAQWHAARRKRRRRGCIAVVLTPVVALAILLGWFAVRIFDEPKITRNFIAEFNERFEHVPESERAWPIYKQAILFELEHPRPATLNQQWPVYPGWTHWDDATDWLEEVRPALDLVRQASRIEELGRPLSDAPDPDIAAAEAKANGIAFVPEVPAENPMVINVLLPELGKFRKFAQTLVVDAFRAAEAGDGPVVVDDLESMLGLAAHSSASETIIGQLVQIAIENLASETMLRVIDQYPGLLSGADLARAQDGLMRIGREASPDQAGLTRLTLDLSMERAFFEDLVQRVYSDDGHGSGHMTLKGMKAVADFGLLWSSSGLAEPQGIGLLVLSAPRRNIMARHDEYMDAFEAAALMNPWERGDQVNNLESEMVELRSNLLDQNRYLLLSLVLPAVNKAIRVMDLANTRRDATIEVIALHRYRLDHGTFPASLDGLVPEYLPRLALDPVDGKPLRYVLGDSGPILYSLGADGDDDGGVDGTLTATDRRHIEPGAGNPENGDWVLYPVGPVEEPVDE